MYTCFFKRILDFLATNSPNKLFDSLSTGKPIFVNSPIWTKGLDERYEGGVFVDPKNPEDLTNLYLYEDLVQQRKDIQHSDEKMQYFPHYRNNEQFSFGINEKQPIYFKHFFYTKE